MKRLYTVKKKLKENPLRLMYLLNPAIDTDCMHLDGGSDLCWEDQVLVQRLA